MKIYVILECYNDCDWHEELCWDFGYFKTIEDAIEYLEVNGYEIVENDKEGYKIVELEEGK